MAAVKSSLKDIKMSELNWKWRRNLKVEIELMRKQAEAWIERSNKETAAIPESIREQNKFKKEILLLEKHYLFLQKFQKFEQKESQLFWNITTRHIYMYITFFCTNGELIFCWNVLSVLFIAYLSYIKVEIKKYMISYLHLF